MLEEQLRVEFAARLRAEVEERMSELDSDIEMAADAALADVMLGYLGDAGFIGEHELCPHEDKNGRGRCRITGFALPDDSTRLELFSARYIEPDQPITIPKEDLKDLTGWPIRFFNLVAKKDYDRFHNARVVAAARRIAKEFDRIEEIRVNVLTNGVVKDRAIEEGLTVQGRPIEFSIWDLERLRRAASESVTRERIEIDFVSLHGRPLSCLEMKPPASEYQTFLVILPGQLLYDLYEEYGARLFEFNVRSFLQAKGLVNKGIRDTIRRQPERFLAYNNGLTATADEIEVGSFHGETVLRRLKGLQIVNGAQTTASIHWARKMDKLDIGRVAVAMKLTRVESTKLEEFVPSIARYANTQNPVQIADLSANSEIHIKLEQLADQCWCPREESRWFYERARGAYQVARARYGTTPAKRRDFDRECPKTQHFGKTELAKYWMSWWQLPQMVSKGAQKNFASFMTELRSRNEPAWQPDLSFYRRTIALAILFKATQTSVRRAKLQSYGANVVTYMIAKLAADHGEDLDFDMIWDNQAVSPELMMTFDAWGPQIHKAIVDTANSRNVTEWCKKDGCWDSIREMDLVIPDDIPSELSTAVSTMEDEVSAAQDPIEACCKLDKSQWARILEWATNSGLIDTFELQVASTIFSYALRGWQKRPSEKQALHGVKIIEAASRAGALDGTGIYSASVDGHRVS